MQKNSSSLLNPQRNNHTPQECSICQSDLISNVSALPCGHCFHRECLEQMLDNRCPNCRRPFKLPEVINLVFSPVKAESFFGQEEKNQMIEDLIILQGQLRLFEEENNRSRKINNQRVEKLTAVFAQEKKKLHEKIIELKKFNEQQKKIIEKAHEKIVELEKKKEGTEVECQTEVDVREQLASSEAGIEEEAYGRTVEERRKQQDIVLASLRKVEEIRMKLRFGAIDSH